MAEEQKQYSKSTIIITAIVIIIILILSYLYYYYSTAQVPAPKVTAPVVTNKNVVKQPPAPPVVQVTPTNIITFAPPQVLPAATQKGNCFASSIAEPFRKDAWRCMVVNSIYDPCFETPQKGVVFCQVNPLSADSVLIKLTKALPAVSLPATVQDNWAWFLTLKDGTYCSPFTGTRPFFSTGPSAQVAYYGCRSNNKDEEIVLLGDLTQGNVWTANEAILTKSGGVPSGSWTIKASRQADVDTVWK